MKPLYALTALALLCCAAIAQEAKDQPKEKEPPKSANDLPLLEGCRFLVQWEKGTAKGGLARWKFLGRGGLRGQVFSTAKPDEYIYQRYAEPRDPDANAEVANMLFKEVQKADPKLERIILIASFPSKKEPGRTDRFEFGVVTKDGLGPPRPK